MTYQTILLGAAALTLPLVAGCGKPPMHPLKGVVTLNGKPLAHCKVGLFPDVSEFDPTRHGYGFGMTDAKGAFTIQHPDGTPGIYAGTYKVTLVAWVDSKGKSVPPDAKPSEVPGGVKNRLPGKYEFLETTPERVTVASGGGETNINVTVP